MIIKTREQFERYRKNNNPELFETIEALEKVTRGVQTLDLMKAGYDGGTARSIHKAEVDLAMAMTEIPDWLTGANHQ